MSRPSKSKRLDADIYALRDPQTLEVRYIGLAVDLALRLRMHIRESRRSDSPKNVWLRSLGDARPAVTILETVPRNDACLREQFWIRHYRRLGADLTNLTAGGESTLGWVPSEETKAKIGAANRGRVHSAEHRAKVGEASRRFWASPAGKAVWERRRLVPRAPITEENRQRMTEGRRLALLDPNSKSRLAARTAGKRNGEARKGKKRGPYRKRIAP